MAQTLEQIIQYQLGGLLLQISALQAEVSQLRERLEELKQKSQPFVGPNNDQG